MNIASICLITSQTTPYAFRCTLPQAFRHRRAHGHFATLMHKANCLPSCTAITLHSCTARFRYRHAQDDYGAVMHRAITGPSSTAAFRYFHA